MVYVEERIKLFAGSYVFDDELATVVGALYVALAVGHEHYFGRSRLVVGIAVGGKFAHGFVAHGAYGTPCAYTQAYARGCDDIAYIHFKYFCQLHCKGNNYSRKKCKRRAGGAFLPWWIDKAFNAASRWSVYNGSILVSKFVNKLSLAACCQSKKSNSSSIRSEIKPAKFRSHRSPDR